LGLSIVKAVVEGYGGWVWVESEVGAGSTFGCVFPALPADQ
jgi:signal transduction histidine kinase